MCTRVPIKGCKYIYVGLQITWMRIGDGSRHRRLAHDRDLVYVKTIACCAVDTEISSATLTITKVGISKMERFMFPSIAIGKSYAASVAVDAAYAVVFKSQSACPSVVVFN